MTKKIGVFFGSRTTEHDVSVTSAFVVMKWLKEMEEYELFPIYINREGQWIYSKEFSDIKNIKDFDYKGKILDLELGKIDGKMHLVEKNSGFMKGNLKIDLDACFHVFHGLNGEDGSIQGLCDFVGVPYIGPSIFGASSTLDKIITKDILKANNFPIVNYLHYEKGKCDLNAIEKNLAYPIFVKPYNLGSSIGISKTKNREELKDAIEVAEYFSNKIIFEEGVSNLVELNCSVCEIKGEITPSLVEEPVTKGDFLNFEEKYIIDESGAGTMTGNAEKVHIPAEIPEDKAKSIREMAVKIYKIFDLGGAPRIDFLMNKETGEIFVNEINPIPGAMQIHLWDKTGIKPKEFFAGLIETAFKKSEDKKLNINFESNILDHTISFMK